MELFIFGLFVLLFLGMGQSTVGVELQYDADPDAEDEAYTSWGCIHDINGPEITVTSTDASCLNSEDGWKEFVYGMKDGGEVTFTLMTQYGENFQASLDFLQTCIGFRIKVPMVTCDGSPAQVWYIVFNAFITKIGPKFEYEGVQMQDWTLKVTGAVTATEPVDV